MVRDFFVRGGLLLTMSIAVIVFTSCATTTPRIPGDAMKAIRSVEIHIGHPQRPLVYQRAVKGAKTGAVVAGMVGILVAEMVSLGVNTQWEGPGNEITQKLDGYDHMAALEKELAVYFDRAGVEYTIHRSEALSDIFARPEKIEEILETSTADAVIMLAYDYRLEQGFDVHLLGVSEVYAVSEKARRFADDRKVIVNRLLDHVEPLENDTFRGKTPEQLADAIIASDGIVIRQNLGKASKKAAASVASLLGIDHLAPGEQYTMR